MGIKKVQGEKGSVNIVFGGVALGFYEAIMTQDVDWSTVVAFQSGELLGELKDQKGSCSTFFRENVAKLAEKGFKEFHFIDGTESKAAEECARLNKLVEENPIDIAILRVGENNGLGFNDPPVNMEAAEAFVVVKVGDAHMNDKVADGSFEKKEDVPKSAIALSMQQIMKCKKVAAIVTTKKKAIAVKNTMESKPLPNKPASFLQKHPDSVLYVDKEAGSLLKSEIAKAPASNAAKQAPVLPPQGGRGGGGFMIRTFRPGQGWVEVGNDVGKSKNVLSGKMSPMAQRKARLAQKKQQMANKRMI